MITGQCSCLPATTGRDCSQCQQGTFDLQDSNPDGCQPCFCSDLSNTCTSAPGFSFARISTDFNSTMLRGWALVNGSSNNVDPQGVVSSPPSGGEGIVLGANSGLFLEAPARYLGNRLSSYSRYVTVEVEEEGVEPTTEYGVALSGGNGITVVTNLTRTESGFRVLLHESAGWMVRMDSSSSSSAPSTREFQRLLFSLTGLSVSGSFNSDATLTSISLDTTIRQSQLQEMPLTPEPESTAVMTTTAVEMCVCPESYTGLSCESCAPSFTRNPSGACEACQCNGFSSECDPETGVCLNCRGDTAGPSCEVCARGFYGNPVLGVACLSCPCPLTSIPGQFSQDCQVVPESEEVSCLNCPLGHTGKDTIMARHTTY